MASGLSPEELKWVVQQLKNLGDREFDARRKAEEALMEISNKGNILVSMISVINSSETLEVKKSAAVYLKTVMGTNLKMTDYSKEILMNIESVVLRTVLLSNIVEGVVDHLTAFLPLLYSSRGYVDELPNSLERSLALMRSGNVRDKYAGIIVYESMVKGLLGMELSSTMFNMQRAVIPIMIDYFRCISQGNIENRDHHTYILSYMIKTFYRMFVKVCKNDIMTIVMSILSNESLCSELVFPILREIRLDREAGEVRYLETIYSEAMFTLNKMNECIVKYSLPYDKYPHIQKTCILLLDHTVDMSLQYIQRNARFINTECNTMDPKVVMLKSGLAFIDSAIRMGARVIECYSAVSRNIDKIYWMGVHLLSLTEEDVKLYRESGMNYYIDLEDYCNVRQVKNVRSMMGDVIASLCSNVESSISRLAVSSLYSISINVQVEDKFKLGEAVKTLGISGLEAVSDDSLRRMSVVCGNVSILCNMSHLMHLRKDLMGVMEYVVMDVMNRVSIVEDGILLSHVLMLYKHHIVDMCSRDSSVLLVIIQYMCRIIVSSTSSAYMICIDILNKMIDIYEEETSTRLKYIIDSISDSILQLLVSCLEQVDDEQYYGVVQKFIKTMTDMKKTMDGSQIEAMYGVLYGRLCREVELHRREGVKSLDRCDNSSMFAIVDIISNIYGHTHDKVSGGLAEQILEMLVEVIDAEDFSVDSSYIEMVQMMMRSHIAATKRLAGVHTKYIGNYFLRKRYSNSLSVDTFHLLNSYNLYMGEAYVDPSLRDRYLLELQTLVGHNLKKRRNNMMGVNACFGLLLFQSMVSSLREHMSRSQIVEVVTSSMTCLEVCEKNESVQAACFSTINVCLVYEAKIAIQTLADRSFLIPYISLLNRKFITITQTPYDRKILVLSVVSLLRNTMGTEQFARVNHDEVFRFGFYLLDYHYVLLCGFDNIEKLSMENHLKYGELQKKILDMRLVRCLNGSDGEEAEDYYGIVNEMERPQERINNRRMGYVSEDEDEDDDSFDASDNLNASDDSDDLRAFQFDDREYRCVVKKMLTSFSEVDEFHEFRQFLIVLRQNYASTLELLLGQMSQGDKDRLKMILHTQKVSVGEDGKKVEYRKMYRIVRSL